MYGIVGMRESGDFSGATVEGLFTVKSGKET